VTGTTVEVRPTEEALLQYELRTQVVEPQRSTFSYLEKRLGDKPATRYEEGSIGIQPKENFHYRPLWAPDHEIYGADWSAVRLSDPDDFRDPRHYYYAPYVANRAELHDAFGKTLDYLEQRGLLMRLPDDWRSLLAEVVLPLRHYESGAQLLTVLGSRFAEGSTVSQCCTYAAFDRVGNAQLLSRVGIVLADGSDELLKAAKQSWRDDEGLQGLRRLVEELLLEPDWAVSLLALDLLDRAVYAVVYRHLDEAALLGGAGAYSLVVQHLTSWFADQRRWLDALYQAWLSDPAHAEANRALLAQVVATRLPQVQEAVTQLARGIDARVGAGAVGAADAALAALREELAAQGLLGTEATA
jgi:phenol hydroxylase P1 protein